MANFYGAPEISVDALSQRLENKNNLLLLDVREKWELTYARLPGKKTLLAPLSQLAHFGLEALPAATRDKSKEIVVICHHGVRSAEVTAWLIRQGWENVYSLAGGLDAYAEQVDPSIGRY